LHATASGKILLSDLPEREVVRLSRSGLTSHTQHTIVRLDLLLEEMTRVRKRGYATSFGEYEPGISAVAVPVFDARADVAAALEVRATGNRISPQRVPELVACIRSAAAEISGHLGGHQHCLLTTSPQVHAAPTVLGRLRAHPPDHAGRRPRRTLPDRHDRMIAEVGPAGFGPTPNC
jgi:hypothetical protein